ncbi:MAG: AAA family ATPase [bacterium]
MLKEIVGNRYKILQQTDSNRLSDTYRASDQKTGSPIAIRILKEDIRTPSLTSQLHRKREVEAVSKISHDNVLKICDMGEYEGRYYIVTECFEGIPLYRYLAQLTQPIEIDRAIEMVLSISAGMESCHHEGIIHQYINPYNILIAQQGNGNTHDDGRTVKVTGFGFNSPLELITITEAEEIRNIFGYMSPEVSGILQTPIDSRADIYSLGILFYRLICGELPYNGVDISTLIYQHIAQRPQPPSTNNKAVPEILDRIVLRLIAKDPQNRYQTLSALISDLKEYLHQRQQGNQAIDFVIARKDRLRELTYSTSLVGRSREIDLLESYMKQTKRSQGAVCLVCGEAGIGKTRLVNEAVKHLQSVNGILARGKCDQYAYQTPYKVFSEVIRGYIASLERRSKNERDLLITKIKENLGELAGEVAKIAPEITRLLGEPATLVEIDAEKEKTRFLITVTNFLLSLGTPEIPVIFFLDDVQWADEASIELFERIAEKIPSYPLLLIAGFRDTEVGATHPLRQTLEKFKAEKIPEIHLKGLALEQAKKIIGQILLEEEDSIVHLTEDLYKRAEGNPFFLVELLHSLVDTGIVSLHDTHYRYDTAKFQDAVLPSNIVDVVLKRISELSGQDSKILSYAAVIGRNIEFEILQKVAPFSPQVLLAAIDEGIKRQFVNRYRAGRGDFSFVHDRIREAFYAKLPEDERRSLHREIGYALEEQNKDNIDAVIFDLVYHFTQAQVEYKTLHYSSQAARKALNASAHEQAIRLYEVAHGILKKQGKTREYIETGENLGVAYYRAGRFDEALHTLRACESLIPPGNKLWKAEVLSKIGDVLQQKGKLEECEHVLVDALKIIGVRHPQKSITISLCTIRELFVQGLHLVLAGIFVRKKYSNNQRAEVIAHLLYRLFYLYYFTDLYKSFYALLKSLNVAESMLGPCRTLCKIYSVTGMGLCQVGWITRARQVSRLAKTIGEDLHDRAAQGLANAFHAIVEWPYNAFESRLLEEKAIKLLKGAGEYWDLGHALVFQGWADCMMGRNFNEVLKNNEETITLMQSINALQDMGWTLGFKGQILTYIGDERLKHEGIKTMEESIKILEQVNDKPWTLCATGILSFAHVRAGNYEEAIRLADRVAEIFSDYNNLVTWVLDTPGMCGLVYLYTIMNKPHLTEAERAKYMERAKHFCKMAHRKGKRFPTYRGWAYQVNGIYQWLCGKKKKGIITWEQGISYLREHTRDTYRLACILLEEASFLLKDDPGSKKAHAYLIEAKEIFIQSGAKSELDRAVKLLERFFPDSEAVEAREALTLSRRLDSLLSVTRAIGSLCGLEELLEKIVDQAMKVTGAERGFLLLLDEEDGTLQQKVSKGIDHEERKTFSCVQCGISLALVQQVEKTQQGLVEDQNGHTFTSIANELNEYGIKEALCVPLKAREKFLGVIYLDNRMAGGIFGQNELELMSSFAVQASISIENAYLVRDLIEHERSLQEMIERAPDAVVVYDRGGNIINVNQQTCESLGYSRDELLNMTMGDINPCHNQEKMAALLDGLGRGTATFPCTHRRKDGSTFPVEGRLSMIEYRGRKVILCLARDITVRKKIEDELQKIQKLESLGVLAGGIAHDFNNLLTTIIGNLSLVEFYAKSGDNILEIVEEIKRASHQTKYLTQQLLTFSQGGEPIKKIVPITDLLKDTIHLALSGSQAKCELSLADDLWCANIDEGQINQVINNLVINAAQAMPEGGIIRVCAENVMVGADATVGPDMIIGSRDNPDMIIGSGNNGDNRALKKGKYIEVSIKDQGVGIQKEHLHKIFDPFFTTKPKGSGLGLAITYSIIKKHGGHITVESEAGSGATFRVYLPAAETETIKEAKDDAGEKIFRGKGKVLCMDDQPSIRNMMGKMLARLGYEVEYAQDGAEAIELYKKKRETGESFDAVIMDLTIPGGMGGKEALKKLLAIDPNAKGIVSSGYNDDPIMSEYKEYGFCGAIAKPYGIKTLSEILHKVITHSA